VEADAAEENEEKGEDSEEGTQLVDSRAGGWGG
jgi:hypothetical protein